MTIYFYILLIVFVVCFAYYVGKYQIPPNIKDLVIVVATLIALITPIYHSGLGNLTLSQNALTVILLISVSIVFIPSYIVGFFVFKRSQGK